MKSQLFFLLIVILSCTRISGQTISTFAGINYPGYTGDGSPATAAELNYPFGVVADTIGNLYITDAYNGAIRKVATSDTITTFLGGLSGPSGIAIDKSGNLYVADLTANKVFKVTPLGFITTIAGTGSIPFSADGVPATASNIYNPTGVAVDDSGNVYIADQFDYRIRKINTMGIIHTIAGNGTAGFSGDGGPATSAKLDRTFGVAVDSNRNVYIADWGNSRIRKVTPSGIITTFAGGGSGLGDGGPATAATLGSPGGVALDRNGNVYISENGGARIRKVNASGIINTIAGNGTGGYSGDGGPATAAEIDHPIGVASHNGFLYFAESYNNLVRKLDTCNTAIVSSISGTNSVCSGSTITLTDSISGGTWSATNMTAIVGSSTGIVTGITAGIDTIKYSHTNSCGTIGVATKIVTINPLPLAGTISGLTSVCIGSSITLTDSISGGTWSATNSNATVGSTGIVTGAVAGIDTMKYQITNLCGTAIATKIVTINPLPLAGTITGSTSVCVGSNITLTSSISGGIWSSVNTGIATVGTSFGIVTGVSAGIDTISYSVTNTCGTASAIKLLTVNPLPISGIINGSSNVCVSNSISFTDSVIGGSWSASNGNAFVSSGGIVLGVSAGIDTISYSVTNTCGTATATKIVTINPLPIIGVINGPDTVCTDSTIILSDTTIGGTWNASNSNALVSSGGSVIGVMTGIDTIIYTVVNACGSSTNQKIIQIINCTTEVSNINELSYTIALYPNPAQNKIVMSSTGTINNVVISNMLGQIVFSGKYNTSNITINISAFEKGLYFIKVNNLSIKKFMRE